MPAKSVLRIPQRSLRILSLPKRRCSVYTTNRCGALAVAHRIYMTYSFVRKFWGGNFAPESWLTFSSVLRQTACMGGGNRLRGWGLIVVRSMTRFITSIAILVVVG